MKAIAALALQPEKPLVIQEVEIATDLGPHEVLVRTVATGICHTDMSVRDAPASSAIGMKPIVLGHEGAGVIERVGLSVTALAPGDRVIMTYYSDGECGNCRNGHEAYCDVSFRDNFMGKRLNGSHALSSLDGEPIAGSYHQQSSFSSYIIATDRNAIKVPHDMSLETLAPLGCGILTGGGAVRNRIKPRAGSSFVVFGMGAVGFAALHMAKKAGCSPIIAVDLHASRLELAKQFGATDTINASEGDSVAEVLKLCPAGVDHAYEATGVVKVMEQTIQVLTRAGSCVVSGAVVDPSIQVKISARLFMKGITIHGTLLGDGDPVETIGEFIEDIRDGSFPIDKLITVFPFEEINAAMEAGATGVVIKPVLRFAQG